MYGVMVMDAYRYRRGVWTWGQAWYMGIGTGHEVRLKVWFYGDFTRMAKKAGRVPAGMSLYGVSHVEELEGVLSACHHGACLRRLLFKKRDMWTGIARLRFRSSTMERKRWIEMVFSWSIVSLRSVRPLRRTLGVIVDTRCTQTVS